MDLDDWMKRENLTNEEMASRCGEKHGETVRRWRRRVVIPRKSKIQIIQDITNNEVTAADFYNFGTSDQNITSTA